MKRGQTEIIGVVLIVVILIIIGLFMFKMQITKQPKELSDSYLDTELSHSFLSSILNTHIEKKNVVLADLILGCYGKNPPICGSTSTSGCCAEAEIILRNALEATLGVWQRDYRLSIKKGDDVRINDITRGGCNDLSDQEAPGYYYITSSPPIVVKLQVCK